MVATLEVHSAVLFEHVRVGEKIGLVGGCRGLQNVLFFNIRV